MRIKGRDVRRVVAWVSRLMPEHYRPAELNIEEERGSRCTRGLTGNDEVEIFYPRVFGRYPKRWTYRDAAGSQSFRCWHEEVAYVAAHEMRHVGQFRSRPSQQPKYFEVDAEAVARFVLDIYRSKRRCRCA